MGGSIARAGWGTRTRRAGATTPFLTCNGAFFAAAGGATGTF